MFPGGKRSDPRTNLFPVFLAEAPDSLTPTQQYLGTVSDDYIHVRCDCCSISHLLKAPLSRKSLVWLMQPHRTWGPGSPPPCADSPGGTGGDLKVLPLEMPAGNGRGITRGQTAQGCWCWGFPPASETQAGVVLVPRLGMTQWEESRWLPGPTLSCSRGHSQGVHTAGSLPLQAADLRLAQAVRCRWGAWPC